MSSSLNLLIDHFFIQIYDWPKKSLKTVSEIKSDTSQVNSFLCVIKDWKLHQISVLVGANYGIECHNMVSVLGKWTKTFTIFIKAPTQKWKLPCQNKVENNWADFFFFFFFNYLSSWFSDTKNNRKLLLSKTTGAKLISYRRLLLCFNSLYTL